MARYGRAEEEEVNVDTKHQCGNKVRKTEEEIIAILKKCKEFSCICLGYLIHLLLDRILIEIKKLKNLL